MKINETPQPTEAELEILKALWEKVSATVREINDHLNGRRSDAKEIGYTTTLKFLQIMFEKGLVERNTEARTHIYKATFAKGEVQRNLLQRLVDTAFQGSAMQMVLQVLGDHDASAEELSEIKALIEKVQQSKKTQKDV